MMEEILHAEWSYKINADEVTSELMVLNIAPDEQSLRDLKRRLNLLDMDGLKADLKIRRQEGGLVVHIDGHLSARVVQACVVTLDPVESTIDERFEAWFADKDQAVALAKVKHEKELKAGTETPILDEQDDPEAIIDGQIDLGELVTQHLSLALNPYPHAEGVSYEYGDDEPNKVPETFKNNPFAALKDWKSKLED